VRALKLDLPMAVPRSRRLGVGVVDVGLVLRNETFVASDNLEGFFLGVVFKRLDNGLELKANQGGR
jgi:hypothetical protein